MRFLAYCARIAHIGFLAELLTRHFWFWGLAVTSEVTCATTLTTSTHSCCSSFTDRMGCRTSSGLVLSNFVLCVLSAERTVSLHELRNLHTPRETGAFYKACSSQS